MFGLQMIITIILLIIINIIAPLFVVSQWVSFEFFWEETLHITAHRCCPLSHLNAYVDMRMCVCVCVCVRVCVCVCMCSCVCVDKDEILIWSGGCVYRRFRIAYEKRSSDVCVCYNSEPINNKINNNNNNNLNTIINTSRFTSKRLCAGVVWLILPLTNSESINTLQYLFCSRSDIFVLRTARHEQ